MDKMFLVQGDMVGVSFWLVCDCDGRFDRFLSIRRTAC